MVDYVPTSYLTRVKDLAKQNNDVKRETTYAKRIKSQKQGTNPLLKAVIDSLIQVDQDVPFRKSSRLSNYYWKCGKRPGCDKSSKKYLKSKKAVDQGLQTDSLNTYFLLDLFEQHGFIGEELVGPKRADLVLIILLHFDADSTNAVLEPVLKNAVNEVKIKPMWYTWILDRHWGHDLSKQIYWTWPDTNREKYPFTEADIPQIIKLRESIGLYGVGLKQVKKTGYWKIINEWD